MPGFLRYEADFHFFLSEPEIKKKFTSTNKDLEFIVFRAPLTHIQLEDYIPFSPCYKSKYFSIKRRVCVHCASARIWLIRQRRRRMHHTKFRFSCWECSKMLRFFFYLCNVFNLFSLFFILFVANSTTMCISYRIGFSLFRTCGKIIIFGVPYELRSSMLLYKQTFTLKKKRKNSQPPK